MEYVVSIHEAEHDCPKLVALAQRREAVSIACHGEPVAKLAPIKQHPVFGMMQGKWPILPLNAFTQMSDDEASAWGL